MNLVGGNDGGEKRQGTMTSFHLGPLHRQAASVVEQALEVGARDREAELLFVTPVAVRVGFRSPCLFSVLSFELCQALGQLWLEDT